MKALPSLLASVCAFLLAQATAPGAGSAVPQAGAYTFLIPPAASDSADAPVEGVGFGVARVSARGAVRVVGRLADGTKFSRSAKLAPDASFTLQVPLYRGGGSLSGQIAFSDVAGVSDLSGTLAWEKPAGGKPVTPGFSVETMLIGSRYTPPPKGTRALALPEDAYNGLVTIGANGSEEPLTRVIALSADNKITVAPVGGTTDPAALSLKLSPKTGLFTGSFRDAGGKKRKLAGALLQKQSIAAGFFLSDTGSGYLTLYALYGEPQQNDSAATQAGAAVEIPLLANDADGTGYPFTILGFDQPLDGTVTIANGVATYTPNAGFRGVDVFTYLATNGHGATRQYSVRVTVTPPPSPADQVAPTPALQLSLAKRVIDTGDQLAFSYSVTGDATPYELFIRARAPGGGVGGGNLIGTAPASGAVFYLARSGTWTAEATQFHKLASTLEVTTPLAENAAGEWLLEAYLRDPATGLIVAKAGQSFFAASDAGVLLQLDRTIANAGDRISARLLVASKDWGDDVEAFAILTLPDGSQMSVPDFLPGLRAAYSGEAIDGEVLLFERAFREFGPGNYHLRVRLLDKETDTLLGLADADFEVCDETKIVSGVVQMADGQPLTGTFLAAQVTAFDLHDGHSFSTAIAADGTYSLSLPAGRYWLLASVLDAAGQRQAIAPSPTVLRCESINTTLNLRLGNGSATALGRRAVAASAPGTAPANAAASASDAATDGLPKPKVFFAFASQGVPRETAKFTLDWLAALVRSAEDRDLSVATSSDLRSLAVVAASEQTADTDTGALQDLMDATAADFIASLHCFKGASGRTAQLTVRNVRTEVIAFSDQEAVGSDDAGAWAQAVGILQARMFPSLFKLLRDRQERPIVPDLSLSIVPEETAPNGTVSAQATLRDSDHARTVVPGKPLTLSQRFNGGPLDISGDTDASGVLAASFRAGASPGEGVIIASFARRGLVLAEQKKFFRVVEGGSLSLSSRRVDLKGGDTAPVTLLARYNGSPMAGITVTLAPMGGTVSAPSVTTGSDGTATFNFQAAPDEGENFAAVSASFTGAIPGSQSPDPVTLAGHIGFFINQGAKLTLASSANSLTNNVRTDVQLSVEVAGVRVPGLPVAYAVSGGGTLSATTAVTNANGNAQIGFVSPAIGEGTATVSATVVLDGVTYTETTAIAYRDPLARYTVREIPMFTDKILPDGRVLGRRYVQGVMHFTIWKNGRMQDLGPVPSSLPNMRGLNVRFFNSSGEWLGTAIDVPESETGGWWAQNCVRGRRGSAELLHRGELPKGSSGLVPLPAGATKRVALNSGLSGNIGFSESGTALIRVFHGRPDFSSAITWSRHGTFRLLAGQSASQNAAYPNAINSAGDVVGQATFVKFVDGDPVAQVNHRMVLWRASALPDSETGGIKPTDLGSLQGEGGTSSANYITESGKFIVGKSSTQGGGEHAVLYDGTLQDLGTLGGRNSEALAVNESGVVIGISELRTLTRFAQSAHFIWKDGVMQQLRDLVPAGSNAADRRLVGIDDDGRILTGGHDANPSYLLVPR